MTQPQPGPEPDPTDMEAEGLPGLHDQPPGIDGETEVEGMIAPRDHPMAVEDPITPAERATPESVAERARREQPEVGAPTAADAQPAGRIVADAAGASSADTEAQQTGQYAPDRHGMSAEEAAVSVDDERPRRT